MEAGGALPAGSGRTLRLDPFALPVRFPARDAGADGQMRQVELDRDRVVVWRAVRGMRMKIRLPLDAFVGITLRLSAGQDGEPAKASIVLDHSDQALSVPLLDSADTDDAKAVWKAWGRVLRLPLRICDSDGAFFELPSSVIVGEDTGRRRRRSAIRKRRPSILMRRKPGRHIAFSPVRRGEREIIARD